MTQKPEPTLADLQTSAIALAKRDVELTGQIDKLTADRTKIRKERRAIEGKITTIRINEQA